MELDSCHVPATVQVEKEKKEKKTRLLRKAERRSIKECIDSTKVILHVLDTVPKSLMPSLYPERMELWVAISNSEELKLFINHNRERYIIYYDQFSKGKDKYANLYLKWLDEIRSYTCKEYQRTETMDKWAPVLAICSHIPESIQRTVIASIMHAVQDAMQLQISSNIENVDQELEDHHNIEKPSDDTSCYRISGWAVKSAIDHRQKDLVYGRGKKEHVNRDIDLLKALRRSKVSKLQLPIGAQFLDRGGLTFVHSSLLSWVHAVEISMKQFLSETGYKKYGKHIFKVAKVVKHARFYLLYIII